MEFPHCVKLNWQSFRFHQNIPYCSESEYEETSLVSSCMVSRITRTRAERINEYWRQRDIQKFLRTNEAVAENSHHYNLRFLYARNRLKPSFIPVKIQLKDLMCSVTGNFHKFIFQTKREETKIRLTSTEEQQQLKLNFSLDKKWSSVFVCLSVFVYFVCFVIDG